MKKYILCPPCGTIFEEETEEELIRITQSHAKSLHGYTPPRDEVLNWMRSARPHSDHEAEKSLGPS
jgi:predicted small metal-binding protein